MNGRMKTLSAILAVVALIGLVTSGMTVSDVLGSKSYWEEQDRISTENLNKLGDGLTTLQENEQAYLDGKQTLADGYEQFAEGQQALADGYAAYEKGKQDYADGQKALAEGAKTLAEGKAGVKQMKDGINDLTSPKNYPTWRAGLEQIMATQDGAFMTDGNVDKGKAKAALAQLQSAVSAYDGVTGLEENGATPEQAFAMVAASQSTEEKPVSPADIAELYGNYESIMDAGQAVDAITALTSAAGAEAFALSQAPAEGVAAYNGVKQALAALGEGATVDQAAQAVVKKGTADSITGDSDTMAAIAAGVAQAHPDWDPDSDQFKQAVAAAVENKVNAYMASEEGQAKVAAAAGAYNQIKESVDALTAIAAIGDADAKMSAACSFVDSSKGLPAGTTAGAYGYYSTGAAQAVKENVDRLQKPTADGGITHEEAVAAVASVAGVSPADVETAYTTVNGMGGKEAAQANIKALTELTKDGGQIDQLKAGKKKMQTALNGLLTKVAANPDLAAKAKAAGVSISDLQKLLNGSDVAFEKAVDTIIALAPGLLEAAQDAIDDGQDEYDAGKAALEEGAQKLADAEQQLADGEAALADAAKQLEDGEAQLAEYEDGVAQVKDGLQTAMDTEADPGIESVAERLGAGFTFENADGSINFENGFQVVDEAWAYKADDGDAITSEMYTRVGGAAAAIVASILALVAAALGFKKKYKGALPCAAVSAVAAAVATILAKKAGMYFSIMAGSTMGPTALFGGIALAVVALVHAVADGSAAKAA